MYTVHTRLRSGYRLHLADTMYTHTCMTHTTHTFRHTNTITLASLFLYSVLSEVLKQTCCTRPLIGW